MRKTKAQIRLRINALVIFLLENAFDLSKCYPMGTQRCDNVASTSMQRNDVASTLMRVE